MTSSANVTSTDSIRRFAAAVISFQEEARTCLAVLDSQLRQLLMWLEQERPGFWKREAERCLQEMNSARVRLHQCKMRRFGDFRPSCIEEQKDFEQATRNLELAQRQMPNVRRWSIEAGQEANEFRSRTGQLAQLVEREIPQLLAILAFTVDRIEAYAAVSTPGATAFATATATDIPDSPTTPPDEHTGTPAPPATHTSSQPDPAAGHT